MPYVSRRGFTLIELSIVLMVLSLMLGGTLSIMAQESRRAKQAELAEKMDTIDAALKTFVKRNLRLPCPSGITLAMTHADFGVEECGSADFYDMVDNFGGGLPVVTLGLGESYAFDPWGGRFLYAVNTANISGTPFINPHDLVLPSGDIQLDGTLFTDVMALVLSFGPNGHGAYQQSGVRKATKSTNANELLNCHCDDDAADTGFVPQFYTGPYSIDSADPFNEFDDTMRYYRRQDFLFAENYIMP